MGQQKFIQLLQSIQTPDTGVVKGATAELKKNYYPNQQSLLWLLHILTSHDDSNLRHQAAVESLRLVPKHWDALPADTKPQIREKLLEAILSEEKSLIRHSTARVIAAIATHDLQQNEWTDLPGHLAQASTSTDVKHREVGTYILFSLLEVAGDFFEDKLSNLFDLFSRTVTDESAEVRVNTLLCLSRVAMFIQPEEDTDSLARWNTVFPKMVDVLQHTISEDDEDRTMQAFEVFQTLLGCESALLNKHFRDLLTFMIKIGEDSSISNDSRTQALSFLMQCAKYRKMKIQGLRDMGELLTVKAMQIACEIDDEDDDDDDEVTPHKSALGLLDLLATSLPPRQVIVPLLKVLPEFVNSPEPSRRQAGILSLGMCVEGAPDFISTQLASLMPLVLKLLNDSVIGVRNAALNGVARLADDLAEELSKHHTELVPALLKNLDAASEQASNESDANKNLGILKSSCAALDSVTDGIDKEIIVSYLPELIPRLGRLLTHPDLNVRASAAGALGSIAGSAEDAFLPYFETIMKVLSNYVTIKDSDEELTLRGIVCDSMGAMAQAVGPAAFQPYVQPLMQASEESLHLGHPRLRETSYILWSTLAKVYEEEFTPFLEGVVKGLMECLDQEENDLEAELGEEAKELLGAEVVVAGKKIKVTSATDEIEDLDEMEDDGDDDDWDDLTAVTAIALEKEIAVEVIGDVLSHTRKNFVPYFEKTIETTTQLVEHSYEGVRKAAIGTLWRAYACLWALMEDHTGEKWTPGLPVKSQPSGEVLKLGEVVTAATLAVWEDESDRAVVTDINRNVSATLKLCGPAILAQSNFAESVTSVVASIITRSHPCQNDMGDEDFEPTDDEESSEYDWLVIDTALDVAIGLAIALGGQFSEIWKLFIKPVTKFASSQTPYERSTAIGVIAEVAANMGDSVSQFTEPLLKILVHRLSDEDPETKSNAAYATGQLIFHSTASQIYLPSFPTILTKLEPLLQTQHARTIDNACGCVCRMIMAHQDKVPVADILPVLVGLLPLKEDYEENTPIFECITGLYEHQDQTIFNLTPQLVPVFASVLSDPQDQLDVDTRFKVIQTVKFIAEKNPALVQGHEVLVNVAR